METSTKNALITAIIPSCASIFVGMVGIFVGGDIISTIEEADQRMLNNNELLVEEKYENFELLSNGIKDIPNNKYPIVVINGINYYPEETLNQLDALTITYDEDKNILNINENYTQ